MMNLGLADISLGFDFAGIFVTTLYIVSLLVKMYGGKIYGGRMMEGELTGHCSVHLNK